MTIPNQRVVADELLLLLNSAVDGRMRCSEVYKYLAKRFPELTQEELSLPYKKSRNKWANTVQYSRLGCVENGYIYRPEDPRSGGRGYWTITEAGKSYLQNSVPDDEIEEFDDFIAEAEEPEDIVANQTYCEGTTKQITVNVYERNTDARRICLAHYGLECYLCRFNFAAVYGEVGAGFIHVHHLKPLAEIGKEYELNPIKDLRPVCPNCHAIIHRRKPAYTLEEVKSFLGLNKMVTKT